MFNKKETINIHAEVKPMTFGFYMKYFIVGLMLWIPVMMVAMIIAFIIPIIGWLAPIIGLTFPFFYPQMKKQDQHDKLKKAREQALEKAKLENLPAMQTISS